MAKQPEAIPDPLLQALETLSPETDEAFAAALKDASRAALATKGNSNPSDADIFKENDEILQSLEGVKGANEGAVDPSKPGKLKMIKEQRTNYALLVYKATKDPEDLRQFVNRAREETASQEEHTTKEIISFAINTYTTALPPEHPNYITPEEAQELITKAGAELEELSVNPDAPAPLAPSSSSLQARSTSDPLLSGQFGARVVENFSLNPPSSSLSSQVPAPAKPVPSAPSSLPPSSSASALQQQASAPTKGHLNAEELNKVLGGLNTEYHDTIKALNGMPLNAVDTLGHSMMHYAAAAGGNDAIPILHSAGFDASLKDSDGKTPMDFVAGGREDIMDALLTAERKQVGSAAVFQQPLDPSPSPAEQPAHGGDTPINPYEAVRGEWAAPAPAQGKPALPPIDQALAQAAWQARMGGGLATPDHGAPAQGKVAAQKQEGIPNPKPTPDKVAPVKAPAPNAEAKAPAPSLLPPAERQQKALEATKALDALFTKGTHPIDLPSGIVPPKVANGGYFVGFKNKAAAEAFKQKVFGNDTKHRVKDFEGPKGQEDPTHGILVPASVMNKMVKGQWTPPDKHRPAQPAPAKAPTPVGGVAGQLVDNDGEYQHHVIKKQAAAPAKAPAPKALAPALVDKGAPVPAPPDKAAPTPPTQPQAKPEMNNDAIKEEIKAMAGNGGNVQPFKEGMVNAKVVFGSEAEAQGFLKKMSDVHGVNDSNGFNKIPHPDHYDNPKKFTVYITPQEAGAIEKSVKAGNSFAEGKGKGAAANIPPTPLAVAPIDQAMQPINVAPSSPPAPAPDAQQQPQPDAPPPPKPSLIRRMLNAVVAAFTPKPAAQIPANVAPSPAVTSPPPQSAAPSTAAATLVNSVASNTMPTSSSSAISPSPAAGVVNNKVGQGAGL